MAGAVGQIGAAKLAADANPLKVGSNARDAKGKITYVHSDPDYKVRLKGSDLVAAAKATLKN